DATVAHERDLDVVAAVGRVHDGVGDPEVHAHVTRVVDEIAGFGVGTVDRGGLADLIAAGTCELDTGAGPRVRGEPGAVEADALFRHHRSVGHPELTERTEHGDLLGRVCGAPCGRELVGIDLELVRGHLGDLVAGTEVADVGDRVARGVP